MYKYAYKKMWRVLKMDKNTQPPFDWFNEMVKCSFFPLNKSICFYLEFNASNDEL